MFTALLIISLSKSLLESALRITYKAIHTFSKLLACFLYIALAGSVDFWPFILLLRPFKFSRRDKLHPAKIFDWLIVPIFDTNSVYTSNSLNEVHCYGIHRFDLAKLTTARRSTEFSKNVLRYLAPGRSARNVPGSVMPQFGVLLTRSLSLTQTRLPRALANVSEYHTLSNGFCQQLAQPNLLLFEERISTPAKIISEYVSSPTLYKMLKM